MTEPTDKQIEAGRMALVDATGHGYGPELARAVYDAMRGAEALAIVPDELVHAAEEVVRWARELQYFSEHGTQLAPVFTSLYVALSLPRRTEAELLAQGAADEWERMAKLADRQRCASDCCARVDAEVALRWLRSQGGE